MVSFISCECILLYKNTQLDDDSRNAAREIVAARLFTLCWIVIFNPDQIVHIHFSYQKAIWIITGGMQLIATSKLCTIVNYNRCFAN